MTRVKICGIRNLNEALAVIKVGADALGFHVKLEHSKCPIGADETAKIVSRMPPYCSTVLVTTVSEPEEVIRLAERTRVTTVQFQGETPLEAIRAVREKLPYLKTYRVVHVFGTASAQDSGESKEDAIEEAKKYQSVVDAIILDSANKTTGARGGTGKTHDWSISRKVVESVSVPVILAGGLNPENVAEAIQTVRPYAVDVETGISNLDHTKNIEKVESFVKRAKSAYSELFI